MSQLPAYYVYVISKPSSDLDGEESVIEADPTPEQSAERARIRERAYNCTLTLVGTRTGCVFTPCLPYEQLPFWAQAYVDAQAPKHLARREKKPRVAKAKKPKATREDGIDLGFDRAMDAAIAEDRSKVARGGR